ncbi:hypothetical protein C8J56DRAFT_1035394 [Mycena floridula]|nr:hypothetical protein C8J56DRAFT_1035394 [Mycena floridula]
MDIGTGPVKESNGTLPGCYVREAKIYDEGMVARWKVLMDGLLLFAALFSAVVTAFIIEGYKTLSPDPSAMTVVLLYHISQQLSAITNTTELQISLPDLNGSPTLAIITNVFWFLSLALSLTCALTATLIEQWASDYVRTIERREAPAIKARIRAYLFEGVENSNVAAIVEGTPLLLHASLFSFFIGLIFFLHPISNIITFLAAGILAAFSIAYLSATTAPLIDTASPIRTPLTTLVLQFSFARNVLRKTSLCGLKLASLVRLQGGAAALACWKLVKKYYSLMADLGRACWKAVKKYSSVVAKIGRASTAWLSNWTNQIRLILSRKTEPDAAEMQPRSEIPDHSARIVTKQWLEPFTEIWSDHTLHISDLDAIKESTALNDSLAEFHKREIDSLSWTLEHTTNDGELLPFLEGIPIYLNSRWSDLHFGKPSPDPWEEAPDDESPAHVLRTVLQHPESTFLSKLDTFIKSRCYSMRERDASAVVNALSSLYENQVHPYTEATRFLHSRSSSSNLRDFMERAIELHPSLSPAIRRLHVMAVLRCAQARGSTYDTTDDDRRWPYSSVDVTVASFRYSELRPSWDAIASFLGFEWLDDGMRTIPTAATAATAVEATQAIALFSLCFFFWEAVPDPQAHFTDTFHHVMYDLISYVSPLAEGSASAQQAYSAALFLITLALEEASLESGRGEWYGITVYMVSKLLRPLVKVTDDAAAITAQRVLCSPWWSTRLPDDIPSRWLDNAVLNQTICARRLKRCLEPWWHASWSLMSENVTTLAGLHSTTQIQLTESLIRWLTDISPDDIQYIPSLFRLLSTLDEPKAVIEVQRALGKFLATSQTENDLDAAREALRELEKKASKPGFILLALASIPDYPLVVVEENRNFV